MARQSVNTRGGRPAKKAWILFVPGKAWHARSVEALLEGAGSEVVSASEIDEVQQLIEYGRPDLAVVAGGEASITADRLMRAAGRPVIAISTGTGESIALRNPVTCELGTLLTIVSDALAPATG